ncbi:ABC transporter ATP-binding protein [Leptolyngbya ohadii]|uniref:ABC transporter ATP-binding protein n=1 Tax=Leptolyngbya ohadii TaxID=1962290 RepID=UPI000B59AE58|nr:ABC transporter ATP-binding protein [Leptolyngbya ohadii]
MVSPASPVLRIDRITRQFAPNIPPAVSAVSLDLPLGELLAMLGPSGCGKTTLLRLIAGFETPQSGTIEIAGQTVAGSGKWLPPERRSVGMVFQDYALFPHLTVYQNVAFGLQKHQKPAELVKQRVQESIALVGLEGMEQRYPHQLSGGQQQRVALARALAPYPSLVLLDEPLSNLDIQVRLRLRQELRDILKSAGTTAIFVTHDQEEALSIADRVAVMRQGHLEQIGTPEELYREPTSRFVAEFVTQANFLPAQRHADSWKTAIGSIPLTQTIAADSSDITTLERSILMIRQEDVQIQPHPQGEWIIRDRQFLGREYRYSLQNAIGETLVVRTAADRPLAVGSSVMAEVNSGLLRVFSEK